VTIEQNPEAVTARALSLSLRHIVALLVWQSLEQSNYTRNVS